MADLFSTRTGIIGIIDVSMQIVPLIVQLDLLPIEWTRIPKLNLDRYCCNGRWLVAMR